MQASNSWVQIDELAEQLQIKPRAVEDLKRHDVFRPGKEYYSSGVKTLTGAHVYGTELCRHRLLQHSAALAERDQQERSQSPD